MYVNLRQAGFTDGARILSHCNIYSLIFLESEFLSVLLFIQNSSQMGLLKNIICVFIVQENILLLVIRKEKRSCNDQI